MRRVDKKIPRGTSRGWRYYHHFDMGNAVPNNCMAGRWNVALGLIITNSERYKVLGGIATIHFGACGTRTIGEFFATGVPQIAEMYSIMLTPYKLNSDHAIFRYARWSTFVSARHLLFRIHFRYLWDTGRQKTLNGS